MEMLLTALFTSGVGVMLVCFLVIFILCDLLGE
jgi:hypothetical protein